MIYTACKVTIKNNTATVDHPITVYTGDKNVEVQFEIMESAYRQYKLAGGNTIENLGASYGQLIISTPYGGSLFSEITPTKDGKVIFTIPESMTDEEFEIGEYDYQIRLYDETQTSRVTLPPIEGGIVVARPIASETKGDEWS